ncbi:Uncharacterised protein [Mycobacteroides abscessus subsp. abscessus]|nr:Uncharacterised protein [Mycobacteroides abscessus subsp. abscessus]
MARSAISAMRRNARSGSPSNVRSGPVSSAAKNAPLSIFPEAFSPLLCAAGPCTWATVAPARRVDPTACSMTITASADSAR